jgi:PAS domain S-box-containing protein
MESFNVLIVEDEVINAKILKDFLVQKGYHIMGIIVSGEDAVSFVKEHRPDLILMDIELAGKLTGIQAAEKIKTFDDIPVMFVTSQTDKQIVENARETDPVGYMIKPFSPVQLEISIEMARKKIKLNRELKNYQQYLEQLVVDRTKELLVEVDMHKKAKQNAVDKERTLTAITSAANDAIMMFDEYGQVKFWNTAAENMFQYTEEEILDQNIRVLFSSDNQNDEFTEALDLIQEAIDKHANMRNVELIATRADGSEISVEMSFAGVDINKDHLIISVVRDISQRKQDLEEIKRFKMISDLANYGLAITDSDGNFMYINKYFARLLEYEQDLLLGRSFYVLTPHVKKSKVNQLIRDVAEKHGGEGTEINLMARGGEEIPVMLNTVIVKDKYEQAQFYAVSAVDIRERKEYEENILKAKKLAEESDRMKTAFLSTISHELRTPLNAIIGFSDLIKLTDVDMEDVKDFNEEIHKSGNHLLSIVEDILDVSLLENKDLKINAVHFSLNNLMENIYQQFNSNLRYDNSGIQLSWNGDKEDGQDQIFADNSKLEQIFKKLIDNAYKFSEKGQVEFGYSHDKDGIVEFFVSDEGKGIPEVKLNHIFESFRQADEGSSRAHDGLGLGLSIVKQLLDLMEGEILVQSTLDKGSVFKFNIKSTQL